MDTSLITSFAIGHVSTGIYRALGLPSRPRSSLKIEKSPHRRRSEPLTLSPGLCGGGAVFVPPRTRYEARAWRVGVYLVISLPRHRDRPASSYCQVVRQRIWDTSSSARRRMCLMSSGHSAAQSSKSRRRLTPWARRNLSRWIGPVGVDGGGEVKQSGGSPCRRTAPYFTVLLHCQLVDVKGARVEEQKHIVHPGKG